MSTLLEPEERATHLLSLIDIQTHCMFEIVLFQNHESRKGEVVERKIFCKAWRKTTEPFFSLDNSRYLRSERQSSDYNWTIQIDSYEWMAPGWNTLIKENRSDKVALQDLNGVLNIRNDYPNVRVFLFSQGYPDRRIDNYYRPPERSWNHDIVNWDPFYKELKKAQDELY